MRCLTRAGSRFGRWRWTGLGVEGGGREVLEVEGLR